MQDITRILILENLHSDYELAQREILKEIPACQFEREDEQIGFLNAMQNFHPDLIVSEYKLQTLDVLRVLSLLQEGSAKIPVVVLTATMDAEAAVECIKAGAVDYVLKANMQRLGPALVHAIETQELLLEKNRAEEIVRSLSRFPEENPGPVLRAAPDGQVMYANPASQRLFYKWECTPGGYLPADWQEIVAEVYQSNLKRSVVVPMGDEIFSIQIVPVREAGYANLYGHEITEAVQAEHDLRESEKRYRTLFEDMPVAIFEEDFSDVKKYLDHLKDQGITDFRSYLDSHPTAIIECARLIRILDINKAGGLMYGVASEKDLFTSFQKDLTKEEMELLKEGFIAIAEGKTKAYWEGADTNAAGESIVTRVCSSVVRGHEMDYSRVIISTTNITERKQAEIALQTSEERFANAFEFAPIGIALVSPEGAFLKVNNALSCILGYTQQELLSKTFQEITHADDLETDLHFVKQMLAGERMTYQMEKRYFHKAGQMIWVVLSVSLVKDSEDKPLFFVSQIQDITERKQAEEEIRRQTKETAALLKASMALTHLDLRAILQSIGSSAKGLFQADGCRIFITEADGQSLRCVLALQENAGSLPNLRLKLGEGVTGAVAASGQAEIVNEMHKDPRAVQIPGTSDEEKEAIMFAPLKQQDRTIGILSVRRAGVDHPFMPGDLDLLEAFASMAASAVSNARLFEEAQRQLSELEALYENGLAVAQLLEPRQIGACFIQTFTRHLSWHHVAIRLLNPATDEMELIAFNQPGLKDEEKPERERHFNQMVRQSRQGLSGWVTQTGVSLRTGNVHAYCVYVETQPGIQSGLYMPLKIGERVIGVISVESEMPDAFTEQDERLLATFGNQAAVAFENARLYQTVQDELLERKRMEEALEEERNQLARRVVERTADLSRANSNLARALRVKDEFLANMSHELRTPLNAILGLSESLNEQVAGPLNEKQQRYLSTINESGHHLLSLINDILDLAKVEAGQITLDISKVHIKSVCEASLRMIKQLAQKKNQEVLFEIDAELDLMWADERRLKQMIVNLLSNAVKFTPEAATLGLEVHGDRSGNRVLITVWDNGIGISATDLDRLFKPFVQLDSGLEREATGTGLGLALVAQMARLHGGSVSVESQLGEGSRFIIRLPWEPALAPDSSIRLKSTGKFKAIDPQTKNKPTILLIEDTREVVMMLVDYLEMTGFKIVTAQDGVEGLEKAKLTHPDLILMDIQMPRMNGFETTQTLRMDPEFKNTPIIALTALAMPNDRQRCLEAGMDEYISKPVNLQALAKLIQNILLKNAESQPK